MSKEELSTLTVTRTVRRKNIVISEDSETETIAVHRFEVDPARVGIRCGVTLNMGNFNSRHVDVSLDIPCYREEIDTAFDFASSWANERAEDERNKIIARAERGTDG